MTTKHVERAPSESEEERRLYGEPQHEVGSEVDPERLYGTPQHEGGSPTNGAERFWLDCYAFRKSVQEQFS